MNNWESYLLNQLKMIKYVRKKESILYNGKVWLNGIYEGELKRKKPNGFGKFIENGNSQVIKAEWKNGKI